MADQQIIARACGEAVVAAEAVDRVIACSVTVADHGGTHGVTIPHRAIREMHDEVAIIGIGECAHDREAVPAGPEGQD